MTGPEKTGSWVPLAALLAAALFWGSSFAIMKVTISDLGPWAVMGVRMTVAFVVVLPFWRKLWPIPYRAGDWKFLIPMCLFEPVLYFSLEANALRFTSSSQAGLISASVPLMVALGAHYFLRERVTKGAVLGLLIAMGGVVWLTLAGDPSDVATNPILGNALELGAMTSAVGYILLVKNLSQRYSPWFLTALQVVVGFLFFLPGAVPVFYAGTGALTKGQVAALIYLGVCVTLGAFGCYNYGIAHIPANRASAFINVIPVAAVFFGWTLLGERLNGLQIAAAACVLAGVWISQRNGQRSS